MATPISKENFSKIQDPSLKMDITFEYILDMYELLCKKEQDCETRLGGCDKRFGKLENRKKLDTSISGLMGVVGGFAYAVLKGLVGRI